MEPLFILCCSKEAKSPTNLMQPVQTEWNYIPAKDSENSTADF